MNLSDEELFKIAHELKDLQDKEKEEEEEKDKKAFAFVVIIGILLYGLLFFGYILGWF